MWPKLLGRVRLWPYRTSLGRVRRWSYRACSMEISFLNYSWIVVAAHGYTLSAVVRLMVLLGGIYPNTRYITAHQLAGGKCYKLNFRQ